MIGLQAVSQARASGSTVKFARVVQTPISNVCCANSPESPLTSLALTRAASTRVSLMFRLNSLSKEAALPLNQVKSRRGSTRKPRDEEWIGSVLNRAARCANKRLELAEQVPSGRYVWNAGKPWLVRWAGSR